jgi:glucose dehydrogenase
MRKLRVPLACVVLLLTACSPSGDKAAKLAAPAAQVDAARLLAADDAANIGQWMSHGRDYSEQRFSPLTKVNTDNASQ